MFTSLVLLAALGQSPTPSPYPPLSAESHAKLWSLQAPVLQRDAAVTAEREYRRSYGIPQDAQYLGVNRRGQRVYQRLVRPLPRRTWVPVW